MLKFFFFFFNDTATTEIYTLSLHDALPIYTDAAILGKLGEFGQAVMRKKADQIIAEFARDRKSTRLNSSHVSISYAVFCLKKKKKKTTTRHNTTPQQPERRVPARSKLAPTL